MCYDGLMARLTKINVCERCGTEFHPWSGPPRRYCTRACWLAVHNSTPRMSPETAIKIGNSLRDRGEGKTYRKVAGVHEHRTVAAEKLGRPLRKGEVVHHIDRNPRNNDPDNLRVFSSQSEHQRFHASL